jgi:hypothetical protein
VTAPPLSPLPGTAPLGTWRIVTADRDAADGRLAIFAILKRPTPTSISLLGTGFYLQPRGGFATAAHVAEEAQQLMSTRPHSVGIAHTLPNGRTKFLPIWKFFIHKTADVAFGIPRYEFVDDNTGIAFRTKILSLIDVAPAIGAQISTWSYPLHQVVGDEASGQSMQLQPDFYKGALQEFFAERGPSAKLRPPYYLTNIHLHGGSSGGPVFDFDGQVFGVASCSYEGATDIAFVTPAAALLEIEVPERITNEGEEGPKVSLRALAARGQIIANRGKDA